MKRIDYTYRSSHDFVRLATRAALNFPSGLADDLRVVSAEGDQGLDKGPEIIRDPITR